MKSSRKKISFARLTALALVAVVFFTLSPAMAEAKVLYNAKITTHFPNSTTKVYAKPDLDSKVLATYKPD